MDINKEVLLHCVNLLKKHLMDYHSEINQAYDESGDDEHPQQLKVALSVKFTEKHNKLNIQTNISFTTGKIQDGMETLLDPNQLQIFDSIGDLRPKEGDDIESITVEHNGRSATLKKEY